MRIFQEKRKSLLIAYDFPLWVSLIEKKKKKDLILAVYPRLKVVLISSFYSHCHLGNENVSFIIKNVVQLGSSKSTMTTSALTFLLLSYLGWDLCIAADIYLSKYKFIGYKNVWHDGNDHQVLDLQKSDLKSLISARRDP